MNKRLGTLCATAFAAAVALALPATGRAGNVGYYTASCGQPGSASAAITAAGHTPVSVATLDGSLLAPLDGLVISFCGTYEGSAAVDAEVLNGLRVLIDTQNAPSPVALPGSPSLELSLAGFCENVSLAPGSPVTNGPGGVLTETNLDTASLCSAMGSAAVSSLPSGSVSFLKVEGLSNYSVAFAYPSGSGLVALSISQWMRTLPGASWTTDAIAPAANTYYTNTISWMMGAGLTPPTTCASEGYTGTKLTWCKNICENGLTGATLDTWIHRWINRYRDLPYCAVEGGGEEERVPTLK